MYHVSWDMVKGDEDGPRPIKKQIQRLCRGRIRASEQGPGWCISSTYANIRIQCSNVFGF